MNPDIWTSAGRHVATYAGGLLGGWLLAKGFLPADQATEFGGLAATVMLAIVSTIVPVISGWWAAKNQTDTAKVAAATALVNKLPADHATVQPLVDAVALKEDQGLAKETAPSPIPGYGKRSY